MFVDVGVVDVRVDVVDVLLVFEVKLVDVLALEVDVAEVVVVT